MKTISGRFRGPWVVAVLVAFLVLPGTLARAGKGGGRGGRAPRHSAPRRMSAPRPQATRMPHVSKPAPHPNMAANHAVKTAQNLAGNVKATTSLRTNAGNAKAAHVAATGTVLGAGSIAHSATHPTTYAYGSGSSTRRYQSYGYGHGYRNRSSGRHYGRSQGNLRALVSRLRSVHSNLARIDHDYRGHRVRAMHAISSAIRLLSHRSIHSSNRFNNALNQGLARNAANRNGNGNGAARQGMRLTQAQSDGRMSQSLRTTQGIQMQMSNTNTYSSAHYAARRHVAHAVREMHTALAIR